MKKINDFGEKIGGAKKDIWSKDGLTSEILSTLNEAEKQKYVTRNYVWPLPNAKLEVENGIEPFVAYWHREVRKMVRNFPVVYSGEDLDTIYNEYVRVVRKIKEKTMNIKTKNEISDFYKELNECFGESKCDFIRYVSRNIYTMYLMHDTYKRIIFRTNFPYTKRKAIKDRKKKFLPEILSSIEREGIDYRHGINTNDVIWQKEFGFRGIEFGNWLSQKDRQISMNYCYDALKDLAVTLNIEDDDITFHGSLALAFGSRGSSATSAHYELLREVINLTKMHGAGSTAHEWMHALDHKIAKFYGLDKCSSSLASELRGQWDKLPKEFVELVKALSIDADGNKTDYLKGSQSFDRHFMKESFGCWSSSSEMLARAFGCYVKDTYGKKSDYLIAHADSYVFEYEDQSICAIPQGEEREIFNSLFDKLFYRLKADGLLHKRTIKVVKAKAPKTNTINFVSYMREEFDGQLALKF